MKKLEKLQDSDNGPKKHYVNMELNLNINDEQNENSHESQESNRKQDPEKKAGEALLQVAAADTLTGTDRSRDPAAWNGGRSSRGQKLGVLNSGNIMQQTNNDGSGMSRVLRSRKSGAGPKAEQTSQYQQNASRPETDVTIAQNEERDPSPINHESVQIVDLQQDSILLNSTLNRGDSTFQARNNVSDNIGSGHGNLLAGVTAATQETSQDTLLGDNLITKRTRGGGLQTNNQSIVANDDFQSNNSPLQKVSTLKKANQNSIFSEFGSQEQVKTQLTLMQKKITDSKVGNNSRNGAFKFDHHTTSDQRQFYGNYSQKNQKYFSKQSGYNSMNKKTKNQEMSTSGYSRVNFTLETDSSAAGRAGKGTSLPRIELNRQVSSTYDSYLKPDHENVRSVSQINTQNQFMMTNTAYQNVPLKKKTKNELYNSVQRKQITSIIDCRPVADKSKMGKTVKQEHTNKDDQLKAPSFFGVSNNGMGISAGLGKLSLRDTLLNQRKRSTDQIHTEEGKPILNLTRKDLDKLLKGKNASSTFIEQNRKELQKYMNAAMKSEENMLGYLEYSNSTMAEVHNMADCPAGDCEEQAANAQNNISMYDQTAQPLNQHQNTRNTNTQRDPIAAMDSIHSEYDMEDKKAAADQDDGEPPHNSSKIQRLLAKKPHKNKILQAPGVTNKVIEVWLNETLSDAEHLDIPGIILKPEHKNPISRYGIDRIELNNNGIPNDLIDRVYRCLFVYSVGFYEMISKIIQHSEQKYTLITRIWKVFAVVLEYCCLTDYKMMITQITHEHDERLATVQKEFDAKLEQFLDNERYLKQNIQVLTASNQELERDRTNERALRLKLEEEYMQNTKNHEEEVQLRLKFESKLNNMHSQQRETDIKYNRALNEVEQARLTIDAQKIKIKEQNVKLLENQTLIEQQRERLSVLEEQRLVWEKDSKNKATLMGQLETRMKDNQEETNQTRYQMSKVANENSKGSLQIEMMETKIQTFENLKQSLESQLKETVGARDASFARATDLKLISDEQLINLNELSQKLALSEEQCTQQGKKIELQSLALQQQTAAIEELAITKKNHTTEISTLREQHTRLQVDFEDSAEKLHQINRLRHELEIKLQSEKLLTEKQHAHLLDKEDEIFNLQEENQTLNETILFRDGTIEQLQSDANDLQQRMAQSEETHKAVLAEQQIQLNEARRVLGEWVEKFKKSENYLQIRQEKEIYMSKTIDDLQADKNGLNDMVAELKKTIEGDAVEAAAAKQAYEKELFEVAFKAKIAEEELEATKAEVQRQSRAVAKMTRQISKLKVAERSHTEQDQMKTEDYEMHIYYQDQNQSVGQQETERLQMEIEDHYRQLFNASHQAELRDFAALDANSKLVHVEDDNEQCRHHIEQLEAVTTEMEARILELEQLLAAAQEQVSHTQEASKDGTKGSRDTLALPQPIPQPVREPFKKIERIAPLAPRLAPEARLRHSREVKPNSLKIAHIAAQTDFPLPEPEIVYLTRDAEPRQFANAGTQISLPERHQETHVTTARVTEGSQDQEMVSKTGSQRAKKLDDDGYVEPATVGVKLLSDMRQQQTVAGEPGSQHFDNVNPGTSGPSTSGSQGGEHSLAKNSNQAARLPTQTLLKGNKSLQQDGELRSQRKSDGASGSGAQLSQGRAQRQQSHGADLPGAAIPSSGRTPALVPGAQLQGAVANQAAQRQSNARGSSSRDHEQNPYNHDLQNVASEDGAVRSTPGQNQPLRAVVGQQVHSQNDLPGGHPRVSSRQPAEADTTMTEPAQRSVDRSQEPNAQYASARSHRYDQQPGQDRQSSTNQPSQAQEQIQVSQSANRENRRDTHDYSGGQSGEAQERRGITLVQGEPTSSIRGENTYGDSNQHPHSQRAGPEGAAGSNRWQDGSARSQGMDQTTGRTMPGVQSDVRSGGPTFDQANHRQAADGQQQIIGMERNTEILHMPQAQQLSSSRGMGAATRDERVGSDTIMPSQRLPIATGAAATHGAPSTLASQRAAADPDLDRPVGTAQLQPSDQPGGAEGSLAQPMRSMEAIMIQSRAAYPDPLAPAVDRAQAQKATDETQARTRKTNNQIKALLRGANSRKR